MGASRPSWWVALVGSGLGAAAILATQYSIGGGVEWGGRYFAVLLPVVVAVVVTACVGSLRRCLPDQPWRNLVAGAAVVATVVLALIALTTLRQGHQWADQLARGVAAAASSAGTTPATDRPIVMTSNRLLPQLLYDDVDRYDWVSADADVLPDYAGQLAAAGVDSAVLVVPTGSELPATLAEAGWTVRANRRARRVRHLRDRTDLAMTSTIDAPGRRRFPPCPQRGGRRPGPVRRLRRGCRSSTTREGR